MATLLGAWHYRVHTVTDWPGVSILWLGEMENLICNFYLSVAACKIEQIHTWDTLACCWDVKQTTNDNSGQRIKVTKIVKHITKVKLKWTGHNRQTKSTVWQTRKGARSAGKLKCHERSNMIKARKKQRKLEDSQRWLVPAADGHNLEWEWKLNENLNLFTIHCNT